MRSIATPLRPFDGVPALVSKSQAIFDELDPRLSKEFQLMQDLKLLDLDNRKGKALGGYQSTLAESRLPFIFTHAVGIQRDVETILHEAGHAFHALATQNEDLYAYRSAPIEFCEVASMAMELLGNEFIEEFYPAAEAKRARRDHLEGVMEVFPWIATVDAFQHWIYSHPGHSRDERRAAWIKLMDRFGGDVDWSGHEKVRENLWHRQLHIFLYPFYYVEYGIAQLGALQLWANSRKSRADALGQYHRSLALGGSRPLPELFAAAGCKFDFSYQTVKPLVELRRAANLQNCFDTLRVKPGSSCSPPVARRIEQELGELSWRISCLDTRAGRFQFQLMIVSVVRSCAAFPESILASRRHWMPLRRCRKCSASP